ncbi:hypothetical protein HME9304_01802 [Flagellimonas maritima]|uniref:Uncharacterized protein n=1 Tax=Flagellimonas maritima TaxID=1383885 RepID=A0A2Z4LU26_9FLAO|nr:hypothetical protein HME9304_01802 [Allomuricauda aurantiaca]
MPRMGLGALKGVALPPLVELVAPSMPWQLNAARGQGVFVSSRADLKIAVGSPGKGDSRSSEKTLTSTLGQRAIFAVDGR